MVAALEKVEDLSTLHGFSQGADLLFENLCAKGEDNSFSDAYHALR